MKVDAVFVYWIVAQDVDVLQEFGASQENGNSKWTARGLDYCSTQILSADYRFNIYPPNQNK